MPTWRAQATGITSFDDLLDGHGSGDGCEVCKPLVSNILASVNNDMIFNHDGMTLQDTNDRALANMQRGGFSGARQKGGSRGLYSGRVFWRLGAF